MTPSRRTIYLIIDQAYGGAVGDGYFALRVEAERECLLYNEDRKSENSDLRYRVEPFRWAGHKKGRKAL